MPHESRPADAVSQVTPNTEQPGLDALLPCPFCGGEAEFERLGTPRQSTIVSCCSCGATLESGDEWNHASSWNQRAAKPTDEFARGVEAAAQKAAMFIIDGNSIHPDLRMDQLSADAKMIAHTTCQHVAEAIRALLATPLQLDEDRSFAAEIEALTASMTALDDWLNLHASDMCDEARAAEAKNRVSEFGTIAYIARVQEKNRAALSALSKRAGEREGDNAVWNEAVEACASLIEPRNPEHDWTEYGRENARRAARIRQQLMRPSPALKRPDKETA